MDGKDECQKAFEEWYEMDEKTYWNGKEYRFTGGVLSSDIPDHTANTFFNVWRSAWENCTAGT